MDINKTLSSFFLMALSCLTAFAQGQKIDVTEWNYIYADVVLAAGESAHNLQALIDTGCTLCVIDSTYAVDSCGMDIGQLKPMRINRYYQAYRATVDSVGFCGMVYRRVQCQVIDLQGLLRQYAPRFIVGANILKTGAWLIDTKRGIMEPCGEKAKMEGTVLRWDCPPRFHHTDGIFLHGKADGQKAWFLFDTGARHSQIQQGLYTGPTERVKKETAHVGHPLDTVDVELCRNVRLSIGRNSWVMDLFVRDRQEWQACGVLNIQFLQDRPFVIDYRKRRLVIL